MLRAALTALAAVWLLGAAKVPTVDYRLGAAVVQPGQPPVLEVEVRFAGDADGQTRLELPDHFASGKEVWRYVYGLDIEGATVAEDGRAVRVLTHKPNARITVRYHVQTAYPQDPAGADGNPYAGPLIRPDWFALLGEYVFAAPEGREHQPATFRWGRLPVGWKVASDLDHGRTGRPMSVDDVAQSIAMGGSRLTLVERPIPGGTLRFATPEGGPYPADGVADDIARAVAAERAYWNDIQGSYFVGLVPLASDKAWRSVGGTGRGDGFVLYATDRVGEMMRWTLAHEHTHSWIPLRLGSMGGKDGALRYWFSEGFTDFFTTRALLRAGVMTPEAAVARMTEQLKGYDANPVKMAPNARILAGFWTDPNAEKLPYQRGALLALKWDEDIRLKTGGKADLDDVVLRMRDHYQQFPPGQGPDVVTGLVSAAWVVAGVDLRPDIARYVDRGEAIALPEQLFDGCLDARVTVTPAFDSGFDHVASARAGAVKGVRRGGPAWTAGLRDGMRIEGADIKGGDTSREVMLKVRAADGRGAQRTVRYWPYGDKDVETRTLSLAFGLEGEKLAACGRKIGGL